MNSFRSIFYALWKWSYPIGPEEIGLRGYIHILDFLTVVCPYWGQYHEESSGGALEALSQGY